MADDEQVPGTEVLAEGEHAVLRYLEDAGIPADLADNYLELDHAVGRWPGGMWLEDGQGSSEELMATVTLDSAGVYRVERGAADLFWDLTNPPDHEDDEVDG